MVNDICKDCEEHMRKSLDVFRRELAGVRAGRATPGLLDRIVVDYYGTPTPVNQLATISVPEPRLLVIQPWDRSVLPSVEKAIAKSDLGLTPSSDGNVIRLSLPQLTEQRRQDLVKQVRKKAEDERVAIRNIRREANDLIKELVKDGDVSEDESRRAQEAIQKLTDKYVAEIEAALQAKEREITEV